MMINKSQLPKDVIPKYSASSLNIWQVTPLL